MVEMKASMEALILRHNTMTHRMDEQEKQLHQMQSAFTNRFERVSLATAEVICYADGMRDTVNETLDRVGDIEHALHELGVYEEINTSQQPMESQAHSGNATSAPKPATSESPAEDERESTSCSSPSEVTLGLEDALAIQLHHEDENDSVCRIETEVFSPLASPDNATGSSSSDLNSNEPELRLEKQETAATSPPEKVQDVDHIHQKRSIRRSLSSWLDSGRRVLRR